MTDAASVLCLLSGPDRPALLAEVDRRLASLESGGAHCLPEITTLATDRERLAIVSPAAELPERLRLARSRLGKFQRSKLNIHKSGVYFASGAEPGRLAFVFPGQGSQHVDMLSEAYKELASVRAWFEGLDDAYRRAQKPAPTRLIYPVVAPEPEGRQELSQALLDMEGAQLGTVASLALYEVLDHLGIKADAMVGHSNGEHAAIIAAGMLPMSDRRRICEALCRAGLAGSHLAYPSPAEGMLAVSAVNLEKTSAVVARFPGDLFLAMDNCPHQQVLAGRRSALKEAAAEIVAAGGICADLPFKRAYHTSLFTGWAQTLQAWYEQLPLAPAQIAVYSCLSGRRMPAEPHSVRHLMTRQWTSSVRFRETIETLYTKGVRTFVEVGPDSKLTGFVEDTLRGRPHLAVSISSRRRGDVEQLRHLLAALYVQGVAVDQKRLERLLAGEVVTTPAVGYRRQASQTGSASWSTGDAQSWKKALSIHQRLSERARKDQAQMALSVQRLRHSGVGTPSPATVYPRLWPLLGRDKRVGTGKLVAERHFSFEGDPFVADHTLGRASMLDDPGAHPLPVLAFTVSLEIMAEAAHRLTGRAATVFSNVRAQRWLALDGGTLVLRTEAQRRADVVHVRLVEPSGIPGAAFEGTTQAAPATPRALDLRLGEPGLSAGPPNRWTAARFYDQYAFHGPSFQGIKKVLTVGENSIEAEIKVIKLPGIAPEQLQLDPALLDSAGQLVAFWLLERGQRPPNFGIFPFAARRITLHGRSPEPGAILIGHGRIVLSELGMTEADFQFFSGDGRLVATLEGLSQRLITLPPPLARWIFSGQVAEFSIPLHDSPSETRRQIGISEWALLAESWGIWGRALAHLLLHPLERTLWLQLPPDANARLIWLLGRIVAKETVRDWAAKEGLTPPAMTHIKVSDSGTVYSDAFGSEQLNLELTVDEDTIEAAVISTNQVIRSSKRLTI